jgi:hypothetical protein
MKTLRVLFTLLIAFGLAAFPSAVRADSDTTGPLASAVAVSPDPATVNTSATVTATVDDSTTGGSNIKSAEYNLNGGSWTAMDAADGNFDSPTEGVTATFTVPQAGSNEVCVRATDQSNNTGEPVCGTFTGEYLYKFNGFRPPIRMNVENKASAPRTVPVKWMLTLNADGTPVSDPASFVAAKSYLVDCTTKSGDPASAVIEKSPGKSGLRYLGRGNWMFNWKTDKAYAGTCRMFFVEFSDGQKSTEVLFHFR